MDRFDLKYAVKEVRRDAARPTVVQSQNGEEDRAIPQICAESGAVLGVGASAVTQSVVTETRIMQAVAKRVAAHPAGSSRSTITS